MMVLSIFICKNQLNQQLKYHQQQMQSESMDEEEQGQIKDDFRAVVNWPDPLSFNELQKKIKLEEAKKITFLTETWFNKNKDLQIRQWFPTIWDHSRDVYYSPKSSQPPTTKAGYYYSKPDDALGLGVQLDPFIVQDDYPVLYHGTKMPHLKKIFVEGFKPGPGQAYKNSKDSQGRTVANGVYFSFWLNQSMGYTMQDNPIILECLVENPQVITGMKGYVVAQKAYISRIIIPNPIKRTNPNF